MKLHPKALVCERGHDLTPETSRIYYNKQRNGNTIPHKVCLTCKNAAKQKGEKS